MAVRSVGDAVRVLNEMVTNLEDLSRSDLETLDSTLVHVHDHVASEINSRSLRRNRGIEADPEASD